MIPTTFSKPFTAGHLGMVVLAAGSVCLLSASLTAQIDQYRLPSSSNLRDYCENSENLKLSECAAIPLAAESSPDRSSIARPPQQGPDFNSQRRITPAPQPESRITERPTEFQRFAMTSTGRMLHIYGASLFEHVPTTFAPLDALPVMPDYILGPGDQIDLRVWGQINFNESLTVDRSGDVFLPLVGRINVSGLRFEQVHDVLKSAIGRVHKNFDLSANMGRLRSIEIFVVGQASRPGTYTVSSLSTLVNAVFASGGPSSRGSMRRIELKRSDKLITTFDLYDLIMRGDKSKDVRLQPGDVVFIPKAGPRVAISGTVETPAIYEIKNGTSLGDVLDDAGGLSAVASGKRAILERVNQHSALQSNDIELNAEGLAKLLQDGDIVRLLPLIPRFENTIMLRGNVADPVRLPWHEGMRISDVLPDKEALLTRNYWTERNRLRDEKQEKAELATRDADPNPAATMTPTAQAFHEEARNTTSDKSLAATVSIEDNAPVRYFGLQNDVQPLAPDIDWNFASIERIDKQTLTTHLIAFNLGRVVINHDSSSDMVLEPGDVITIFSRADIATPRSEQTKYVRLEGEINMAGVYSAQPGEKLRQLVMRAGGLSANAYLYGLQFTRESTRREQQKRYSEFLDQLERDINQSASTIAGRVLSSDQGASAQASVASQRAMVDHLRQAPSTGRIVFNLDPGADGVSSLPDLPLENGDRLFVPSVPLTMNVVGTVYNQSSFLFASDLRLGDYLKEAGGPAPSADKNHIFVIRANGFIVARETRSRPFNANFESLRMYPGDTVVVPTNLTKTTRMRELLDWSQVFSGFGLAAAAVNVLK